jgi:hypothetical protein
MSGPDDRSPRHRCLRLGAMHRAGYDSAARLASLCLGREVETVPREIQSPSRPDHVSLRSLPFAVHWQRGAGGGRSRLCGIGRPRPFARALSEAWRSCCKGRACPRHSGCLAELRRIYPGKADALTAATKGVAVDGLYVLRMQRYGSAENRSQCDAWHRDEGNDDAAIGHPVHSSSPQPIERRAGVVGTHRRFLGRVIPPPFLPLIASAADQELVAVVVIHVGLLGTILRRQALNV